MLNMHQLQVKHSFFCYCRFYQDLAYDERSKLLKDRLKKYSQKVSTLSGSNSGQDVQVITQSVMHVEVHMLTSVGCNLHVALTLDFNLQKTATMFYNNRRRTNVS